MQPLATDNTIIHSHRIAYKVLGSGFPVVLLHGTPSSSLIWRNVVPKLTQAGYRVHLYDLLGYGESERPWNLSVDTSITGQVPILEELLQHWGLLSATTKFHLVAHDIGGAIAQRFAILSEYRSSISSLTLIDSVSYDSYPSRRTFQMMEQGLEKLIKASDEDHRAHYQEWLLSAVVRREEFKNSSLPTYLEYISGPIGQGSLFQHQIMHYDPKHTTEISHRYHELGRFPVQLIWGKEDMWQVTSWAEQLRDAIPGAVLQVVEQAGHFSLEDQPDEIGKTIIEHLAKHSEDDQELRT